MGPEEVGGSLPLLLVLWAELRGTLRAELRGTLRAEERMSVWKSSSLKPRGSLGRGVWGQGGGGRGWLVDSVRGLRVDCGFLRDRLAVLFAAVLTVFFLAVRGAGTDRYSS